MNKVLCGLFSLIFLFTSLQITVLPAEAAANLNYDIVCTYPFRIMRNADLTIEEEEAEDLLQEIEKQLKKRQWGQVIRLEVEEGIDNRLLRLIREELAIPKEDIYAISGPLDLTFLMKLYGMEGFEHLKEHSYLPPQIVPELPEDAVFLIFWENHNKNTDKKENNTQRKKPADIIQF